jgi:Xaa-Pro dipeptidase
MISSKRFERVCALMRDYKIQGLAINAGSDLKYLTGLDFHLSERPAILLITANAEAAFIFPEFEKEKAGRTEIPAHLFPYPEDSRSWPEAVRQALEKIRLTDACLAVSPTSMRYLEISLLQQASAPLQIISGADVFREIFIQKDNEEIQAAKQAVTIAQQALLQTLPEVKPGKTEKEIANLLVINLLKAGSEPELAFSPIVAAGPNSANPHANPGDRKMQSGDLIIFDWGARYQGYVSDITRTFALEQMPDDFLEIAFTVLAANQAARKKIRDGVSAGEIDAAARNVIDTAGYGEFFLHRTGHGIGLNAHEDPYISQSSTTILKPGMMFTIEPGIYLSGKGGVRIEDNVVVTRNGAETLTSLPRELMII